MDTNKMQNNWGSRVDIPFKGRHRPSLIESCLYVSTLCLHIDGVILRVAPIHCILDLYDNNIFYHL